MLVKFSHATQVFYSDFNSGMPAEITGGGVQSVGGYEGLGNGDNHFSGNFLRNDTGGYYGGPQQRTTLTLSGLPSHTSIDIDFLLATIDSWDGESDYCGKDYFEVGIDNSVIFYATFDNFNYQNHDLTQQGFVPDSSSVILTRADADIFGPGNGWYDAAYDMSQQLSQFHNIPHIASTLTIEFFADGSGWQGDNDESWAIDNLKVSLNGVSAVPDVGATSWLLLSAMGILSFIRRRQ